VANEKVGGFTSGDLRYNGSAKWTPFVTFFLLPTAEMSVVFQAVGDRFTSQTFYDFALQPNQLLSD
jgi:hypothetical protein